MGLLVHGRLTRLRRAGAADVDRLVAWHADPNVALYRERETFARERRRSDSPVATCR